MQGYNFTQGFRTVLSNAREASARLDHEYVGTEHMLLGLLRRGEGGAIRMLEALDVDLNRVRTTIEDVVQQGGQSRVTRPDLPYTSRAKHVLELAMAEAREAGHSHVGSEHLLLGMIREEHGIAAQALMNAGVTLATARAALRGA